MSAARVRPIPSFPRERSCAHGDVRVVCADLGAAACRHAFDEPVAWIRKSAERCVGGRNIGGADGDEGSRLGRCVHAHIEPCRNRCAAVVQKPVPAVDGCEQKKPDGHGPSEQREGLQRSHPASVPQFRQSATLQAFRDRPVLRVIVEGRAFSRVCKRGRRAGGRGVAIGMGARRAETAQAGSVRSTTARPPAKPAGSPKPKRENIRICACASIYRRSLRVGLLTFPQEDSTPSPTLSLGWCGRGLARGMAARRAETLGSACNSPVDGAAGDAPKRERHV